MKIEYKIFLKGVLFGKSASAIYRLFHTSSDNLVYIGSSKNVRSRFNQHIRMLIKGRHHSSILQNLTAKYGHEGIVMDILEICEQYDLKRREQYYIDNTKCINVCRSASSSEGFKHSQKTKDYLSNISKGRKMPKHVTERIRIISLSPMRVENLRKARCRPVLQLNESNTVINRFDSLIKAQMETGIAYQSINSVALGKRKRAGGFYWKFDDSLSKSKHKVS